MRVALLSGGMLLAFGGQAQGAVTIGGNTAVEPSVLTGCGGSPCTLVQRTAPAGTSYVVPTDGVVVRWRIRTQNGTGQWRIRAVAESAMGYSGAATGPFETVEPGAERTFAARVPVQAGTLLGVDGPTSATAALGSAPGPGGSFSGFHPPLADGGPPRTADQNGSGFNLQYNADIEADADGDGYGDETQDLCPTDATRQTACLVPDTDPPETTITKRPKDQSSKPKAKLKFVADEPGSTFECKLKGKGLNNQVRKFSACVSPRKYGNLQPGRYKFKVRATDAAGNVDAKAAKDKFKVVA